MSQSKNTRATSTPPECFKKLDHLCNVCGQLQQSKKLRPINENLKTAYLEVYEKEIFCDGVRAPAKVCDTCRLNITRPDRLLRAVISPMIWENHKQINETNHDPNNCYCCKLPTSSGHHNFRNITYPYNVTTITPPVFSLSDLTTAANSDQLSQTDEQNPPRTLSTQQNVADSEVGESEDNPDEPMDYEDASVSNAPLPDEVPSNASESVQDQTSEPPSEPSVTTFASVYEPPRKVPRVERPVEQHNAEEFKKLIERLSPMTTAQIRKLAHEMRQKNQLSPDVKITEILYGHKNYTQFFQEGSFDNQKFMYCNDIGGLLKAMGLPEESSKWRLWIDSSRIKQGGEIVNSFKAALLHIGNEEPSVPIFYSNDFEEKYTNLRKTLEILNYDQHNWKLCVDLKVAAILVGRCGGRPRYPCHLCEWDSKKSVKDFYKKSEKNVSKIMRKSYSKPSAKPKHSYDNLNIENDALVPAENILIPPLHIRLGIFNSLFQKLNDLAQNYLTQTKFPRKKGHTFNGPEILKICRDGTFYNLLRARGEKEAFNAFKDVSTYVLTSKVHPNKTNEQLVDALFKAFEPLQVPIYYKLHLLRSHLNLIQSNMDAYSDQHGEHFHQLFRPYEKRFAGKPIENMLAKWCFEKTEYSSPILSLEEVESFCEMADDETAEEEEEEIASPNTVIIMFCEVCIYY